MTHPDRPRGPVYDLPAPRVQIGQQVDPKRMVDRYARHQILRWQIRNTITILRSLRAQGYDQRRPGEPILSAHTKGLIRQVMRVVDSAYEAEVAGIHASPGQPSVANQCYVGGSHAWSGITYYCQLLFRAEIDGQHVAYLHPEALFTFPEHAAIAARRPDLPVREGEPTRRR